MPQPESVSVGNPPAVAPPVPHRWRGLALLTGALVVDSDESKLISTLFPVLRSALAVPTSALGVMTAVGQLVSVVTGPLWMWLARRTNRKNVLVVCSGMWGVWGIAAGFAENYAQLLILTSIVAAGFAGAQPIISEMLADLFDDRTRGRATGYLYGAIQLFGAGIGPLIGLLSTVEDGWRYGFYVSGALNVVVGVLILIFFRDPGIGAAEPQLAALSRAERDAQAKLTWARLKELMRIRTFVLMLLQRLLSSHLIILSFGVLFLVDGQGFSVVEASLVLLPMNVGYFLGTLIGGVVTDRVQLSNPRTGRIVLLQGAQLGFALVAFLCTQFDWGSIIVFCLFFAGMGFLQGVNPGINRPIVMAVTPPELRGAAFTVMLSVVQSLAWALYSLGTGYLAEAIGLRAAFFWLLVVVMVANAVLVTLIYRPYVRDCAAVQQELDRRAQPASS